MPARERALSGDVADELIDEESDRARTCRIAFAIRRQLDRKIQMLAWPPVARHEHLEIVGHPREDLGTMRRGAELAAASMREQHRRLGKPATERRPLRCVQRTDARAGENGPPEAHLKTAHPPRVALRTNLRCLA